MGSESETKPFADASVRTHEKTIVYLAISHGR